MYGLVGKTSSKHADQVSLFQLLRYHQSLGNNSAPLVPYVYCSVLCLVISKLTELRSVDFSGLLSR